MAREIRSFGATIPAGTLPAAPVTVNLAMPVRIVTEVDIVIPPGPNGLVGFALGAAGNQVIPAAVGSWIIGNGEIIRWPLSEQITSGAWQLFGYNTGNYSHTIQIRFLLDLVQSRNGSSAPAPLSAAQIVGAIDLSAVGQPVGAPTS